MLHFEIEKILPKYPEFGMDPYTRKRVVDPVLVEFENGNSAFWNRFTVRFLYYRMTKECTTAEKVSRAVSARNVVLYDQNVLLNRITKITIDPKFKEMLKTAPTLFIYPYFPFQELS